jgi:uncharacterized protein
MILLNKYDNLTLFKNDVISFLEEYEAENNLVLGILQSLSEKDNPPLLMATVLKNNKIGLVLLQTIPRQIILSKSVSLTSKEIHIIGEKLINTIHEIPGLVGEKKLTEELAMYISNVKGIQAVVHMDQILYKLEKVNKSTISNGTLLRIKENQHHTIKEWVYQFCYETHQPVSYDEAAKKAKMLIEKGNLVGWEVNGELVSMACATRPTRNNITISFVYTPISKRKRGYASDCVSAFTQSLLDRGYKSTSLYTDANNPTSNKIYIEIGYAPIMDAVVLHFK